MALNTNTVKRLLKTIIVSVLVGVFVLGLFQILAVYKKQTIPNQSIVIVPTIAGVTPQTRQQPTSVHIPKIKKNLPIQAALVHDNEWDMFDSAVAWLSTSAVPGEGNVILYAHNWKTLWGDLYKLVPGDEIIVDQNNNMHTYIVTESRAVKPTDVDVILSEDDQLTLYTCEGTFDQKRRVVFAKPV